MDVFMLCENDLLYFWKDCYCLFLFLVRERREVLLIVDIGFDFCLKI